MANEFSEDTRSWWVRLLMSGFGILAVWVVALWAIEIVDTFVLGDQLQRNGIRPRATEGLDGVIWAPWLHSDFGHVTSNTVPLVVLGWLTTLRGLRFWLIVTLTSMLAGGGLVWLFAGGTNHIGASGVVFGYFGALMGAAIRSRRPQTLAPAMVAIFLYGTILVGIVPQDDISWEGHLFGLLVGLATALVLVDKRPRRSRAELEAEENDVMYPWELDEPWRTAEE